MAMNIKILDGPLKNPVLMEVLIGDPTKRVPPVWIGGCRLGGLQTFKIALVSRMMDGEGMRNTKRTKGRRNEWSNLRHSSLVIHHFLPIIEGGCSILCKKSSI